NDTMNDTIADNVAASRFELAVGDEIATAYYRNEDGRVVLTHTEVPQALSGQGVGTRLARGVFETLRQRQARIIARCPFMAAFAAKHTEYSAMLDG
ncbi:MAG: GNAT family N-acetyltransferase, partial [Ensifer adhaerens]